MSTRKKTLAVIGDPVLHSLSPLIHNAALRKLRLPFHYVALHVTPKQLKKFIRERARRLAGFNLTLPHKEAVLPLLDVISHDARVIGAVNTVLNRNGKLVGFNTDGAGYLRSLEQEKKFLGMGKRVVLLGAGGAARSIAAALALQGIKQITVANRTLKNAKGLIKDLKKHLPESSCTATPLHGKNFLQALARCDLLINTTRVGLGGSAFTDFPWRRLKKTAMVSDIVYTPRITPFLKVAKKLGHPIHSGEGMLVHQGALAFQLWTGKKPDTRLMLRVLRKALL